MGLNTAVPALPPATNTSAVLSINSYEWKQRALEGESPSENFSSEDKAEADRCFGIIEALVCPEKFPEIWQECRGRKGAVELYLSAKYGSKTRTIRNWVRNFKLYGMQGLVNQARSDKGVARKVNQAADEYIVSHMLPKLGVFGTLTVSEGHRGFVDECDWREEHIGKELSQADSKKYARYMEDGKLSERARLPRISEQTYRRRVGDIPEPVLTLARNGKEAYRNSQEIISHRALSEIEPLEYLVGDHRLLDVFCRVPVRGGGWKVVRPWLTCFIDMRTRRWLAWVICETPSSDSIAHCLKKAFIEHGVPRNCYIDNGRDFRSEYLNGKNVRREKTGPMGEFEATWLGVFATLGVRVLHSLVRNARAKIIEPNFLRVKAYDKQLPEYCGHRPSERPERLGLMVKQHEAWLRNERPESPFRRIQDVATFYDAAMREINEMPLEGEGMRDPLNPPGRPWMSPGLCWDRLISKVERRTVRIEDLRVVFTKRRELTVKHGEICSTFNGQKYYYRLEGEPTQLMVLNGKLVTIAFDPHELGQVACYWEDRFIGLAHCIPLRKMGEDLFAEDERNRRAAQRDIKRAVDSIHRLIPVTGPEERLARRREVLPQRLIGGVGVPVVLPEQLIQAQVAIRAEREFRFTDAVPVIEAIERPADEVGEPFKFFSDDGGAE